MRGFICPGCDKETPIFAATTGGAKALCEDYALPYLGSIPLDPMINLSCDKGVYVGD